MTYSEEILKAVPRILGNLYDIHVEPDAVVLNEGGRLSSTFMITQSNGKKLFLKISRPGQGEDNTFFSAQVIKRGKELGLPFVKLEEGKIEDREGGKTAYKIYKDEWEKDIDLMPECLHDQTVILMEYHEPPKEKFDAAEDKEKLCELMGEYLASYSYFDKFVQAQRGNIPSDPISLDKMKQRLYRTFQLEDGMKDEEINAQAVLLSQNLEGKGEVEKQFADSLKDKQLSFMLQTLEELEKNEQILRGMKLPVGLINNDIKYNNFFFERESGTGELKIRLAFDLDMVTEGPFVKDLGRTIQLNCFDPKTGALNENLMRAVIQGRIQKEGICGIESVEAEALAHYIKCSIVTSYALRAGYFADMLEGKDPEYEIDYLNPALHVKELQSLEQWLEKNNLVTMIDEIQSTIKREPHSELFTPTMSPPIFRKGNSY